jgi:hypothetical protein
MMGIEGFHWRHDFHDNRVAAILLGTKRITYINTLDYKAKARYNENNWPLRNRVEDWVQV